MSKAATQRLNVQISKEAYERLHIHSVMLRKPAGDLVTELIDKNLNQFRLERDGTPARAAGRPPQPPKKGGPK